MKKILLNAAFIAASFTMTAQVGVGTTDPKSALEISSTTSGILIPRMNTTTRSGLTVGADQDGMMVYDTDTKSFWYYEHSTTSWKQISGKFVDGTDTSDAVYNAGSVGIGVTNPKGLLQVGSSGGTEDSNLGIFVGYNNGTVYDPANGQLNNSGLSIYNNSATTNAFSSINFAVSRTSGAGIARISAIRTGAIAMDLAFTTRGVSGITEKMRINGDGSVGIGVTNPKGLLQVGSSGGTEDSNLGIFVGYNNGTVYDPANGQLNNSGLSIYNNSATTNAFSSINFAVSRTSGAGIARISAIRTGAIAMDLAFTTRGVSGITEKMRINGDGNVGIGISTGLTHRLNVDGNVSATGTFISGGTTMSVPDYVFENYFNGESKFNKDYSFMSLKDTEMFLKKNYHLPNMQSRNEVKANNGNWDITRANLNNLEKIEELFLHTIEQQKQIDVLKAQVKALLDRK